MDRQNDGQPKSSIAPLFQSGASGAIIIRELDLTCSYSYAKPYF